MILEILDGRQYKDEKISKGTHNINANELMWNFFKARPRRDASGEPSGEASSK